MSMKGEIINCSAHKDIYFLETNDATTKSESHVSLPNLFVSPAGRDMFKYKPRSKLKHKLNPALEFFIQNKTPSSSTPAGGNTPKTATMTSSSDVRDKRASPTSSASAVEESSPDSVIRSRRSSLDLYEEAASILGLTCSQTDGCKCLECQCHYFDFDEDLDYTSGEFVVDHSSSCTIQ